MDNKMMLDAYFGTGGFLDGSYLIKHPRETDKKYEQRKQLAYYINHVAVAVNSQVDPIFKDEIKREWNPSPLFERFKTDVDRNNTDLQELMKQTAQRAKLLGYSFLLMDNTVEQPATIKEAEERRLLPYIISIPSENVGVCEFDEFGQLSRFKYHEIIKAENGENVKVETEWTKTRWKRKRGEHEEMGDHNLGRVPVTIWQSRLISNKQLPSSEFTSIVQCNYSIYQKCSWLDEILANQAFSILVYPGEIKANLTIGTENALTYPEDSPHTPMFITPPSTSADILQANIQQLVTEIYRMANLSTVTGVREATSGIAKAWDFQRANQALAEYSYMCQRAEYDIIDLFERWTGEKLDYHCEYPRDFAIADLTDELENAQRLIDLNFKSGALVIETVKRILAVYFPNIQDEVYDQIIDEITKSSDEIIQEVTYGQPPV